MQIRIKEVGEVESMGKYNQFVLKFSQDGQDKERTLRSFVFPEAYHTLLKSKPEEVYEIKLVKDGKYWNWTAALPASDAQASMTTAGSFTKKSVGEWETREERAARQVLIVRQSCISSAVNCWAGSKVLPDVKEVIAAARMFEDYVFDRNQEVF